MKLGILSRLENLLLEREREGSDVIFYRERFETSKPLKMNKNEERVHGEDQKVIQDSLKLIDAMIVLKILFRLVLKGIHLRQYQVLSSSSTDVCALNLGRNQQSHLLI